MSDENEGVPSALRPIPAVISQPMTATNLRGQALSGGLVTIAFDRPLKLKAGDRVFLPQVPDEQSQVVVTDEHGEEKEVRRYQDGAYRFVVDAAEGARSIEP